jgi:hypothetical protein
MSKEKAVIEDKAKRKKTNIGALVKSILAAAIGVQSNKNRGRQPAGIYYWWLCIYGTVYRHHCHNRWLCLEH